MIFKTNLIDKTYLLKCFGIVCLVFSSCFKTKRAKLAAKEQLKKLRNRRKACLIRFRVLSKGRRFLQQKYLKTLTRRPNLRPYRTKRYPHPPLPLNLLMHSVPRRSRLKRTRHCFCLEKNGVFVFNSETKELYQLRRIILLCLPLFLIRSLKHPLKEKPRKQFRNLGSLSEASLSQRRKNAPRLFSEAIHSPLPVPKLRGRFRPRMLQEPGIGV